MPARDPPHPMDDGPATWLASPWAHLIAPDATAQAVATAIAAVCREVDAVLRPILGQRGVVALLNRSIQLSAEAHPWLAAARQDPQTELQWSALASLFSQQEATDATSGGEALLLSFHQLLCSLIGASLTQRLLRPAFSPASTHATGASPPQDAPP
jgi:hypothetical protein